MTKYAAHTNLPGLLAVAICLLGDPLRLPLGNAGFQRVTLYRYR